MPLKTDPAQQRHPLSLRQRLILALLTPLIVILTVSSYFDYRLAKKTANNAHDNRWPTMSLTWKPISKRRIPHSSST